MVNYLLKNKSMVEEKKERKHTDYYRHFPEERSQAAFSTSGCSYCHCQKRPSRMTKYDPDALQTQAYVCLRISF